MPEAVSPIRSIEEDVGALLHQLEPNQSLLSMAKAMFRQAWDIRSAQSQQGVKTGAKQISEIDKQIDSLLDRIVKTQDATVIRAYEGKIDAMEKEKIILQEKQLKKPAHKTTLGRDFDEMLELSLHFLASP